MGIYWISWYETSEDYRPLTDPPNEAILGWWNTGSRYEDDATMICALVSADDEAEAKEVVLLDWPGKHEWRFIKEKADCALSDRFPLEGWRKERIDKHKAG